MSEGNHPECLFVPDPLLHTQNPGPRVLLREHVPQRGIPFHLEKKTGVAHRILLLFADGHQILFQENDLLQNPESAKVLLPSIRVDGRGEKRLGRRQKSLFLFGRL